MEKKINLIKMQLIRVIVIEYFVRWRQTKESEFNVENT